MKITSIQKTIFSVFFVLLILVAIKSCYNNKQNQKSEVQSELNNQMKKIIGYPENYKPVGKPGVIENVSFADVRRFSLNIDIDSNLPDSIAEKEIRYWLYDTWEKSKRFNALMIRLFKTGENSTFKMGTLAPKGIWSLADVNLYDTKLSVKIE